MKYKILITILICIVLSACNNNAEVSNTAEDSLTTNDTSTNDTGTTNKVQTPGSLVTGSSFAGITASSSYTDLEKLFGKNNIKEELMYGAEGLDSFMVTKVFSGIPREIIIYWSEGKQHKKVASVETVMEGSPYTTEDGLKIGSTLQQLLTANGKPVNFYGTSWDYGGTISSYNKGKYENSNIRFQLEGKEDMNEQLMGDQELNTNMPLVKQNLSKLYISKMFVLFDE